jgi:hypothetical protein
MHGTGGSVNVFIGECSSANCTFPNSNQALRDLSRLSFHAVPAYVSNR